MMNLAYNINPGWPYNGIQQHNNNAVDWAEREGLNWEASGHQGKNWSAPLQRTTVKGNSSIGWGWLASNSAGGREPKLE
jgi:hypothetical protein